MKTIHLKSVILGSLLLTLLSPSMAQEKSSQQFTCVTWESHDLGQIYYLNAEKYKPLTFQKGTRSKTYPLGATNYLKLYTLHEEEGETVYKLVGEGRLPAGTNQSLFLIQKNAPNAELPLQVLGIDDSLKSFPRGSYKFANFTSTPLEVEINGSKDQINPEDIEVVKPNFPKDGGLLPFYIRLPNQTVVYETRLFTQSTGRKIVFIYPSTGRQAIAVKFLSQLVAIPKPQSTNASP